MRQHFERLNPLSWRQSLIETTNRRLLSLVLQNDHSSTVRLSKRMGDLDLCSRRDADRLILAKRVIVDGNVMEVGDKVPFDLSVDRIEILPDDDVGAENHNIMYHRNVVSAVVLHKPQGYVSGQAEHGHTPAIRLLTRDKMFVNSSATDIMHLELPASWRGFAPAGRLDVDSRGLLVFSKSGVVTKKIIASNSAVQKEYLVRVSAAVQPTRRELSMDPSFQLPRPTLDLRPLLKGGHMLLEEKGRAETPLKPCVDAQWVEQNQVLRIVLTEGKKRHIRRACRELLGWHVTDLQRVRIGPVQLHDLPEGKWRPLTQKEIDDLLSN